MTKAQARAIATEMVEFYDRVTVEKDARVIKKGDTFQVAALVLIKPGDDE